MVYQYDDALLYAYLKGAINMAESLNRKPEDGSYSEADFSSTRELTF